MLRSSAFAVAGAMFIVGCSSAPTEAADPTVPPPSIEQRAAASAPTAPAGLKNTCLADPNSSAASATCPVVVRGSKTYWAFSADNNTFNLALVAYEGAVVVGRLDRTGARYIYDMSVNAADSTVALVAQASTTLVIKWDELP